MITIAGTAERHGESRVALSPEAAKKLMALGCLVKVETGAGTFSRFNDDAMKAAGEQIARSASDALEGADILLKVRRPTANEIKALKPGAIVVAMLSPFDDRAELDALAAVGASLMAMEFVPRISRAQSMDVLSSQANLAGYKAVVDAAGMFGQAIPMMMTAARTVPAARTFIMGVGVAGLQAIATARRLGAIVSATDVRPATKEQVASLGAKFIAVEDDEFRQAQTAAGYAKPMSAEYQKKQAELFPGAVLGRREEIPATHARRPHEGDAALGEPDRGTVLVLAVRTKSIAYSLPGSPPTTTIFLPLRMSGRSGVTVTTVNSWP
jgi:NAD(P) transhydrogenase subunit alpha